MSTAGAATLAVVRETATQDNEKVTKEETGTGTGEANTLDILVKLVPTGIVAIYSLILASILQALPEPTSSNPQPNEYVPWRIGLWALFVIFTLGYAYTAYRTRLRQLNRLPSDKRRFPWELLASTIAFAIWGIATPGNWLATFLDDQVLRAVLPGAIGLIGVVLLGFFSQEVRDKLPT